MDKTFELIDKDDHVRSQEWVEFESQLRTGPRGLITMMMQPMVGSLLTITARDIANRRISIVATKALLYKADNGEFPDTLDKLVPEYLPEIPTDPFDGKPIRYIDSDDKIIIYSI